MIGLALTPLTVDAIRSPYARQGPLVIREVRLKARRVKRYEVVEADIDLGATYENPFDPEQIAVDAHLVGPSGKARTMPGFLYRPYTRRLDKGKEVPTPAGPPVWKIRVTPTEVGRHALTVTVRDRSGVKTSSPVTFHATPSSHPGFVGVSKRDPRFFAFTSGQPYYPVGLNTCWGGDPGTFAFDRWFPKYGAQGVNYGRLWLGPSWSKFAIETPGSPAEGKGFGQFDLGNAWRLDHVLDLARRNGIYLMLCLDSYNTLRDKDAYPNWELSALNTANGGPLGQPQAFWTDARVQRQYRNRLRYLVARYGANPHVMSWEFWNEVDLTRGFDAEVGRRWHREMAQTLRRIDPYDHLLSTSFSDSNGRPTIDALPELDFVQTHLYSANLVNDVASRTSKGAKKPHFVGEVGADWRGPRVEDKEGLQVHDALWAGIANGMAGTAMTWWWDNLVEPNDLYAIFGPPAKFVRDIDWPKEGMRPVPIHMAYTNPRDGEGTADLELVEGPAGFGETPFNRPQRVTIRDGQVSGDLPLAGRLHGVKNHPEMHNPVTFELHLDRPTQLEILVGTVSGYGGAALRVTIDGKVAVDRPFADPDGQRETAALESFAGPLPVEIPAGRHQVVVENTGDDWMMIGYRLIGVLARRVPPLDVTAICGRNTAIAWLRVSGRSWQNIVERKRTPAPVMPTTLMLKDLPRGTWTAEVWDTWTGKILSRSRVDSDGRSSAPIAIPKVERDLAIKLRRTGGRTDDHRL